MIRRQVSLLSIFLLSALSGGCVLETTPETMPDAPLVEGAYMLEGEAELGTSGGLIATKQERLTLFVDASGTPTHLHDRVTDDMYGLTFRDGLSQDVCTWEGCELRVERDTGCAVFDYTGYFRVVGFGDSGHRYTGRVIACPTDEPFEPVLQVSGELVRDTVLPSGRLFVEANYPIDRSIDTWEMTLDGAPLEGSEALVDMNTRFLDVGPMPVGSNFEFRYTGTRAVSPVSPTGFSTNAIVEDLSFDTAPAEGAIDSRSTPIVYEDGALLLRDEGQGRSRPFASLIALGDPGTATHVVIDVEVQGRAGGNPMVQVVRADGATSEPVLLWEGEAVIPAGPGGAWLLITSLQDVPAPNDRADPLVFTLNQLTLTP